MITELKLNKRLEKAADSNSERVSRHISGKLRELEEKASGQIAVAQDEVERMAANMRRLLST